MNKFAAFDDTILSVIRDGRNTFHMMWTPEIREMVQCFLPPNGDEWRVLERRLQALRKAGRIAYVKGHWQEVQA